MTRLRQGSSAASWVVAIVAAIGLAAFSVVRGTWAVGGSDSSCYGLMAKAFASLQLQPLTPLALSAPWPDAAITFAPGGFIPSPVHHGAVAPICAPGFSVLMSPLAALFGPDAIFWLTPLAAALLVLSAFTIARQLVGGMAGAMAAILTATSPIVLYQSVQPMNDIVTAALWLAAIAAGRRHVIAGLLIGTAILVRPNLAPLALVMAAIPFIEFGNGDRAWRALAVMAGGAVPGVAALLMLNRALYGSVVGSGYGGLAALFSAGHFSANLTNYGRALWDTQNAVPVVGVMAPVVFTGLRRVGAVFLLVFAAVVTGIYLFYAPFPEWWYLRFLIPALVILLVLASAVTAHGLSRANMGGLIPIVAVVLGILGMRAAGQHDAFALQALEGRYRQSAELVRDRLPVNAVVITEFQSGSVRFHAGREVVLWESLDPSWLDGAITWLKSQGLQPYILVERREESAFRTRFRGSSEFGGLDWPPRFDLNRQVRIFDPADRTRYLAGEAYPTEQIGYPRRIQSPTKM
jgi:hypothetical protein